jgi:ATP-dependent RNA helicase DHX57
MNEAHRNMLVDVLRHVATGGTSSVSDAHFDHRRNAIVFQRNRPLTRLEMAQVVFERLGFPSEVVSAYIAASCEASAAEDGDESEDRSAWLPEYRTIQELTMNEVFLDSVAHDLFLTLVSAEAGAAAADVDESMAELLATMRSDEWATIEAMFDDILVPLPDGDGDGAEDGDEEVNEDAYDDRELRLMTKDNVEVKLLVRVYGDYPAQSPSVLIPATANLSPGARHSILSSAASCVAAHAGTVCLLPLIGAAKDLIGDALSAPAEEVARRREAEEARELAAAKAKEMKMDIDAATGSRQQFLDSLLHQDKSARPQKVKDMEVQNTGGGQQRGTREPSKQNGGTSSAPKKAVAAAAAATEPPPSAASADSAVPVLPQGVKLKTVDAQTLSREFVRTTFVKRDSRVDDEMLQRWQKTKQSGSLSRAREALPAFQLRDELRKVLKESRVVVVGGDTGSGKTTQIPQYVWEYFCEEKKASLCNIVCTQPRRLAATAVALRVAEERDENIGDSVGYSIRLENRIGPNTRLLYCTTGILLRRMQADANIGNISHVIVDEIHERGVDTDFLLILLRDLLRRRNDLTVILMSATMNAAKFSEYFGGTPVLTIPGRTHPVTVTHLEKIIPQINYVLEEGSRFGILEGVSSKVKNMRNARHTSDISMDRAEYEEDRGADNEIRRAAKLAQGEGGDPVDPRTAATLARMDPEKINYELVDRLVEYIDRHNPCGDGAVLIFMPGLAEITRCIEELRANPYLGGRCVIFNLHSSLGNADQKAVFARPPKGKRKIVVGTNIMETSITIDDAVYVIDCGKFKENRYDPRKTLSQLVTCWVSKAAARQRTGRAGRVRPGQCFRLFTTGQYERLEDHQLCEMQRVPLESLILQIHVLNLGDEMAFLRKAMDPPVERAVQGSVAVLTGLGALTEESKQLTSLGYHLANLPLDVRIGKMIIIGSVMRCLDPVLTIAACVSVRSPFQSSAEDQGQMDAVRRGFSRDYNSDLLAMYFAYSGWLGALEKGGQGAARKFCTEAFLSTNSLTQIQVTKQQYERYLVEAGFIFADKTAEGVATSGPAAGSRAQGGTGRNRFISAYYVALDDTVYESGGKYYNANSTVVKCVVASLVAGLYPNVAKIMKSAPTASNLPPGRVQFLKAASRDGSDVAIHPSSVNASKSREFTYPFLCYVEKIKTSYIFLRETTMVSPYSLVLFGGPSVYLPEYNELIFDNWVSFACAEEDAVLLMRLKEQLESALMAKINDPMMEWESTAGNVVRAMEKLLKDEGSRSLVVVDRRDRRTRYTDPGAGPARPKKQGDKISRRMTQRKRLVTCFNCGEKGHLARDCKNRILGIGPTEPCFICGARAHYPTQCPVIVPKAAAAGDDGDEEIE